MQVPDDIFKFRSHLGIWQLTRPDRHPTRWHIVEFEATNPSKYVARYKVIYELNKQKSEYQCNYHEAVKTIASIKEKGYILHTPQYPELIKMFNSGVLVTHGEILHNEIQALIDNSPPKETRTGFEILMDNWK